MSAFAAADPAPDLEPVVLAHQLHHQLQHDLAHSPVGPAPAPAGYLDASRTLLAHLQRSLDSQEGTHDYRLFAVERGRVVTQGGPCPC